MKYYVVVNRHVPYESSYEVEIECFADLNAAIVSAKGKIKKYPDDIVTIEVEGWRE